MMRTLCVICLFCCNTAFADPICTLNPDAIVSIALQNNPTLQAEFENIGIAHGDLINAGLLSNPHLSMNVRVPNMGGYALNSDFTLTMSMVDFFLRPLKVAAAASAKKQVCAEAAHALLKLACEAEIAYDELAYGQKIVQLNEVKVKLAETALDIAQMQASCGNISHFALKDYEIAKLNAILTLETAKKEQIGRRSILNILMGITDDLDHWNVTDPEPYVLAEIPQNLTGQALEQRYDLQAAMYKIYKIAREGQQKQWWNYTDLRLGVSSEQEVEGVQVTGPVVELSLPLFNQGQGDRFRLLHELKQSQNNYEALYQQIIVEVKDTADSRNAAAKDYALIKQHTLPKLKEKLQEAQTFYNFMAIGVFDLIAIKKEQIDAQIQEAKLERELAKSDAMLRFATGSPL